MTTKQKATSPQEEELYPTKKAYSIKEITKFFIRHKDEKTIRIVVWDKNDPEIIISIAEFSLGEHYIPRLISRGTRLPAHIKSYISMYPDELLSFELPNKGGK